MKNIIIIDEKDLFPSELDVRECKSCIGKEGGIWFWLCRAGTGNLIYAPGVRT